MASEIISTASTETVRELQPTLANDRSSENSEEDDENFPEGVSYPLNSKKLVVGQLRRLATMLEFPCEGSAATLRQVLRVS